MKVEADHLLLLHMSREVAEWCEDKGWANDGRTFGDDMALLHSEISEALEAYREHGIHDYAIDGVKPEGVASEFADLFIRLLDCCARYDVDLFAEYRRKMDYNYTREHRHGGKAL